ncbi:hypothetical protein [Ammoniphilus sp. CFH 90114]|uniref:hypothetical protein n=1 Tax=Ammoniphilus sp. CFH 90114 TaxID=2493665 RepID=UPI00100FEC3F|nr:hypothetical protein [Ammoniphilus sp. CFH 90114]RXT14832.1 hypothetical protein EIZ39_01060 [Ammoniphilus sp. CFH 90114]
MIGWLIDLIFSNLWLVFILFWVFRSFSRGVKQGMEDEPSKRQPAPVDFPWENERGPIVVKRYPPVERPIEVREERQATEERIEPPTPHKERVTRTEPKRVQQQEMPTQLPPAVQGMLWSQIFGPPRAKAPHSIRKRI